MDQHRDNADQHPLLAERLHRPRTVFAPGHKIVMNIIPMFLNVFVPWGCFILVAGLGSFFMMYSRPVLAWALIGMAVIFWLGTVAVAVWARMNSPSPQWFTYFALMVGIAVIAGIMIGQAIYSRYEFPFYSVRDLKVVGSIDAHRDRGQNVMDAGMFYFADGNHLDTTRSWHFKHKTLYCVAPVIGSMDVPASQTFDFWAVGKDCCSMSSSDFRCGAFLNSLARGGIRLVDDDARPFYRLAVEQAESLYDIRAPHPIFFEWVADPLAEVNSWNSSGFKRYLTWVAFAFMFCLFSMCMATASFSWIGRGRSVYDMDFYDDPEWRKGGEAYNKHIDYHTHLATGEAAYDKRY